MSQAIQATINPDTTSGTQLAGYWNGLVDALMTGYSGTSRPTTLEAGGCWVDVTNAQSPNYYWSYKIFDGNQDVEVFRVNLQTNRASFSGTDNTFLVTRATDDAVGPLAQLVKERIAGGGAVLVNDVLGELQFLGEGSDSALHTVARIRAIATNNIGASAAGGCITIESTTLGTAVMTEIARFIDGKMGLGITTPAAAIHTRSATGVKHERYIDDAASVRVNLKKSRILGNGQVLANDVLTDIDSSSTDSAGTEFVACEIETAALEAHTPTNRGTRMIIRTTPVGSATLTDRIYVDSIVTVLTLLKTTARQDAFQTIAGAATIAQLDTSVVSAHITGTVATTIQGANSAGLTKILLIHNLTTQNLTITHQDAGAAAADRFKLPLSKAIILYPNQSAEFFYSTSETAWKLRSSTASSGGAGGGGSLQWVEGNTLAPTPSVDAVGNRVYAYSSQQGQTLYAGVKVPHGYVSGNKINLYVSFYSSDATLTTLIQAVTTLVRPGTTVVTSTTNQNTSSNAAIVPSAANVPQQLVLNLTDANGAVNGVSVQPDDMLLIQLTRPNADTSAADANVLPYIAEITFS